MLLVQDQDTELAADRHLQRVRRYLRFLGCPASALDDVAQETLVAGLGEWPTGDAPLPWLLATARNQLRKLLRDQGRRRELADVDRLDAMWQRHVPDAGDARGEALRACLAELPPRSRAVLQLRYGDGLDRAAIGARVGLGVEGVKSLLVRLREALARCIRRRCQDD